MTDHKNNNNLTHVPGKEHYSLRYLQGGRIFSYAHQIDNILLFHPRKVLEVGAGGGMVTAALRSIGIEVTTVDVQSELEPDVVASVTDLPFDDNEFDVTVCCQVLEHLPFNKFDLSMKQMRRVSSMGAVVSLPDVTKYGYVAGKLPKIPAFSMSWMLPRLRSKPEPDIRFSTSGHYWEIGCKGYSPSRIRSVIRESGWVIASEWRVRELCWHHFYRLDK